MVSKIINWIERYIIARTIKNKKPNRVDLYLPNGKHFRTINYLMDSQSRTSFNENGRQSCYVYAYKGKIRSCITYEYNESNQYSRIYDRKFKIIGKERILESDRLIIFNNDKTRTVIKDGVRTDYPEDTVTEVKDERGNVTESMIFYPERNCTEYTVNTFDEHGNLSTNLFTVKNGDEIESISREINKYDSNNNLIKQTCFNKTDYGKNEHISTTVQSFDDKNRCTHIHVDCNYNKQHLGYGRYTDDTYYRYDENGGKIYIADHGSNNIYKTYQIKETRQDGYAVEKCWSIPAWTEKLRKFFKV